MTEDLINQFDRRASLWLFVGIGFAKTIEHFLTDVLAEHFVEITVSGVEVTVLLLYFSLGTIGTTALIFSKTIGNSGDRDA